MEFNILRLLTLKNTIRVTKISKYILISVVTRPEHTRGRKTYEKSQSDQVSLEDAIDYLVDQVMNKKRVIHGDRRDFIQEENDEDTEEGMILEISSHFK